VQILDQQHLSISEGPSFQGNTWQNKFVIVDKEGNICLPILGHKSSK
jgi:protein involved in polysaccharide export with SLBB domain